MELPFLRVFIFHVFCHRLRVEMFIDCLFIFISCSLKGRSSVKVQIVPRMFRGSLMPSTASF
uniref:Uncharacterized protein n=1 Tax=Rhizophora mucronata TaxID=61149 RepID=A0A2P2ITM3_RHIMU